MSVVPINGEFLPEALFVVGIVILAFEVLLLGFSTFIFFFVGMAFVTTGLLIAVGLVDAELSGAIWSIAILIAAYATLLWKPLKNLQNKPVTKEVRGDYATEPFVLKDDVDPVLLEAKHRYSGVVWNLRSEKPIPSGTLVEVFKLDVGTMWVRPVDNNK